MKWITKSTRLLWLSGGRLFVPAAALCLWLSGCATAPYPAAPSAPSGSADSRGRASAEAAPSRTGPKPAEERPGLATGFGETTRSPWNRQSFVRATPAKPAGTAVVFYNDKEGIDAMTGWKTKTSATRTVAGDLVEWGIKGSFSYLPTYMNHTSNARFVTGSQGSSYSIVLKNRCKSRLEVVLSVDGLDVIDGKTAAYSKRGYVIAPGETLEVKGWRTSPDTVARFTFSSVAGSYSNLRHGEHRNVGVIGLAVFTEKGVDPWTWMPREVNDRITANPFATAP